MALRLRWHPPTSRVELGEWFSTRYDKLLKPKALLRAPSGLELFTKGQMERIVKIVSRSVDSGGICSGRASGVSPEMHVDGTESIPRCS